MIKKTLSITLTAAVIMAGSATVQASPVVANPNIKVKPRSVPGAPRGPRISPQQKGALNIRDISDISSGYNTEGDISVDGYICPRTFLLFPSVTVNTPVSGQIAIELLEEGIRGPVVGTDRFSASDFRRLRRGHLTQTVVRFTPDWKRLGANYQFTFDVKVNSPAGTNWRVERQYLYHKCRTASRRSKK